LGKRRVQLLLLLLDRGLGFDLVGDVLVGRHPAAVRHRLIDDLDDAPGRRRHVLLGERPLGDLRQDLGVILLGAAAERPALLAVLQQVEQGQSRFDHLGRQAIDLDKACVDDDEP
jgi:hypothetical protein